jgi:Purine catabolism regulatory protein-like family/PucR C-terminal helix-turn-helix domain
VVAVLLAELLAEPELGLRLLTGSARAEVSWAHSTDLADPTPFLETGNLLLTTGTQFSDDADEKLYAEYAARLAAVGVAAVGFGTEVVRAGTPAPLLTACAAVGLPLLEVPFRTPFIAITRRIAEARASQQHARDRWTLEAQRSLSLAALARERIAAVLDELARRLRAAVLLFDGYGEITSSHGARAPNPAELAAIGVEAGRLLHRRLRSGSALELPTSVVSLQTLGRKDELRGVLAVVLDARPDSAASAVITSAVALAEFAVEDAARQQESRLTLNAELLELAVGGGLDVVRRVLAVGNRVAPEPPLRVLVSRAGSGTDPGELEHALAVRAAAEDRPVLASRWRDAFVAVVEDGAAQRAVQLVAARRPTVVVSRAVDWTGLDQAVGEALSELGRGPADSGVVELSSATLFSLLARPEVADVARRRLAPLRDDPDGGELRRALTTWLEHNAAWEPAARELGLHRHTLKAQVRRASGLLGLDLDTFEAKAELWALLRVG